MIGDDIALHVFVFMLQTKPVSVSCLYLH